MLRPFWQSFSFRLTLKLSRQFVLITLSHGVSEALTSVAGFLYFPLKERKAAPPDYRLLCPHSGQVRVHVLRTFPFN
jgi:hypothetical protein